MPGGEPALKPGRDAAIRSSKPAATSEAGTEPWTKPSLPGSSPPIPGFVPCVPACPTPRAGASSTGCSGPSAGVDNPALNLAIAIGNTVGQPVLAVFGLTADYPEAQRRHYRFLVEGLVDAAADLAARGVPLVVRLGSPDEVVPAFAEEVRASFVVGDENPVRVGQKWREQVAGKLKVPFSLVDADVVVPTSLFPKEEFAARTLRPKIHRVWDEYLKPLPNLNAQVRWTGPDADRRASRPGRADGQAEGRRSVRGSRLPGRHARGDAAAAAVPRRAAGPLRDGPQRADAVHDDRALRPPALRPHQPADDRARGAEERCARGRASTRCSRS